jgi:hypothetical protein
MGANGYSIFGIAVVPRHTLKCPFTKKKPPINKLKKVCMYSENALTSGATLAKVFRDRNSI